MPNAADMLARERALMERIETAARVHDAAVHDAAGKSPTLHAYHRGARDALLALKAFAVDVGFNAIEGGIGI